MKKIAFYIESWAGGGAEKQLVDLVNHLDYSEYDVTIISIFKNNIYASNAVKLDLQISDQVKLRYLVDNNNKLVYRLFNHVYAHFNKNLIYKILIKEKYDYEIAYYEGMPTEFVSNSTNLDSIKLAWLHTDNRRLYKNANASVLNKAKSIYSKYNITVAVSKTVEQSFKTYFPQMNTCTIINGLDLETIDRKYDEDCPYSYFKELTLLSIGRFTHVKGYKRLLSALGKLYDEGYQFKLMLIGDGEERKELQDYIDTHNLHRSVILTGAQNNPFKYMKIADYYVCSSYYEGFTLTVAESIACGLPVLGTECCKNVFGDFACGVICDNSEDAIYEMIKGALNRDYDNNSFKVECMKRRTDLSIEKTADNLDKLLRGNL